MDAPRRVAASRRVRWFITFHVVCLAWVFFRAESFTKAGELLLGAASPTGGRHARHADARLRDRRHDRRPVRAEPRAGDGPRSCSRRLRRWCRAPCLAFGFLMIDALGPVGVAPVHLLSVLMTTTTPPKRPDREPRTLRYHDAGDARPLSAGQIVLVGSIAFGLAGLFNAESLYATARRQPYGWKRTVALDVVGPVRVVQPLHAAERAPSQDRDGHRSRSRGRHAQRLQGGDGHDRRSARTAADGEGHPTHDARTALRLWVGGDSMAQEFGTSMIEKAGHAATLDATLDYHVSTGSDPARLLRLAGVSPGQGPAHQAGRARPDVRRERCPADGGQRHAVQGADTRMAGRVPQARRPRDGPARPVRAGSSSGSARHTCAAPSSTNAWGSSTGSTRTRRRSARGSTSSTPEPVLSPPGGGYAAYLPGGDGQPQLARAERRHPPQPVRCGSPG